MPSLHNQKEMNMYQRLSLAAGALIALALVITPASAQTFTSLLSFTGTGGQYPGGYPNGDLTLSGTTLYGLSETGGSGGYGNVFSIGTNGGGFQILLSFSGTGGGYPNGSLTLGGTTLYGTTEIGGSGNAGTVFSVGTNGVGPQTLLNFSGSNGNLPQGSLTLSGTTLYGMTFYGSNVFSIGADGSGFQNLVSLIAAYPYGSLTLGGTTLYGMTGQNGGVGNGTLFSIGIDGSGFKSLLSFTGTGGADSGGDPTGSLTLSGTTLYGMTLGGGSSGKGNLFSVGTDGSGFKNLLSFSGTSGVYPGLQPWGSLILSGTTLYGMTKEGGSSGDGNIFSVGINGSGFENLLSFTGTGGAHPGEYPKGDLMLSDGILYGTTSYGGAYGDGTAFSLTLPQQSPEPSTLALLAASALGLAGYRSRRRTDRQGNQRRK
jgi:uncharacterized repeat protein (TIGR03803 family)